MPVVKSPCERHDLDDDTYCDQEFFVIGDRVYLDNSKSASVAYFGEVEFASGDWVGLALDEPAGNHDGRLHGRQYFQCAPLHGIFVRPNRVSRMQTLSRTMSYLDSDYSTNPRRLTSPTSVSSTSYSPAAGSSVSGYYYDDDYRPNPNESLINHLNSYISGLNNRYSSSSEHVSQRGSGYRPSRSSTPVGILKRSSTEQQDLKSRIDDVSRRIRAQSASRAQQQSSVFNFRPKREPLEHSFDDKHEDYGRLASSHKTVNLSSDPINKGDRVLVRSDRGDLSGILRFMGETNFATGEWAGIELDTPDGKNDGSVLGHRYFHCSKNYGLFVPLTRVRKYDFKRDGLSANYPSPKTFSFMRSTVFSPPPISGGVADYHSGSSSVTPSYEPNSTTSPISSASSYSPDLYSLRPSEQYGSRSLSNDTHRRWYNGSLSRPEKFDDKDIEAELKRSLQRPKITTPLNFKNYDTYKPKSIRYTFSSSKYDGNPIARRTVLYD